MAKYCWNCGKGLEENAAVCLNCGVIVDKMEQKNLNKTNKEKKRGFPTWAIILIVISSLILIPVIFMILVGVFSYNIINGTINNLDDNIEKMLIQEGTIGDTLVTESIKITLYDISQYDSLGDEYNKKFSETGKEYVVFFFNIENISDQSIYISTSDFIGYISMDIIESEKITNVINGIDELNFDIAPGNKTKGYVVFEVDTAWQEFELHFNKIFDNEDELVFNVINKESSNLPPA